MKTTLRKTLGQLLGLSQSIVYIGDLLIGKAGVGYLCSGVGTHERPSAEDRVSCIRL